MIRPRLLPALLAALAFAPIAQAQEEKAADLAKKLSNPVADLISLPFQLNYNHGYAGGDGEQWQLNIQPVIPFSISENWNVISRTILPVISQDGVIPTAGAQLGFGPTTQSFYFSPKAPTRGGLIWGVGPVILVPTATDGISTNQWGGGVTGVALTQKGPWTIGVLANHVWSLPEDNADGEISLTYLQPILSYTTPKATSFTVNTESIYDWVDEEWSVPVNAMIGQVMKLGKQPVQLSLGTRYWAQSPEYGPENWGARLQVTFLFPK